MTNEILKLFFFVLLLKRASLQVCPQDPEPICFTQSEFNDAFDKASISYNITENILLSSMDVEGFLLKEDSALYHHFRNSEVSQYAIDHNRFVTIAISAIQTLKISRNYTKSQIRKCMERITTANICPGLPLNCNPSETKYYRLDGQCNSKVNPHFGAKETPLTRILEDGYEDGYESYSKLRTIETARSDSIEANNVRGRNDGRAPEMNNDVSTMAFQILTHELEMTKKTQLQRENNGGGFDCCNENKDPLLENLIKINKYCTPIDLKDSDPCYAGKSKRMNYIRSFRAFDQCNTAKAPAPMNFHTPVIDCELVYNDETLKHLFENNGLFDINNHTKMEHLLVGYDGRSNQLPGLFLFLSLFLTLHNFLFIEFRRVRPTMTIEQTIFETRKITTAVYQKITVEIISSVVLDYSAPPANCYSPHINPQVSVEFDAAFRTMHYFIRDKMGVYDARHFSQVEGIKGKFPELIDQFILLDNLTWYTHNKCGLTHGLLDVSWNLGGLLELTHCRFMAKKPDQIGADLRTWDFEHGREIGEPSYASFARKFLGFKKCDFEMSAKDLLKHDDNAKRFLMNRYQNKIWEMGLSVGLDFESPHDPIVSFGMGKIIKEQMDRCICGDRFWFNHINGIFNTRQREMLNSFDILKLICLAHNCNGTRIQFFPFLSPGSTNLKTRCASAQELINIFNLRSW